MSTTTTENGTSPLSSNEVVLMPPTLPSLSTEITLVPPDALSMSAEPLDSAFASINDAFQNGAMLLSRGSLANAAEQLGLTLKMVERCVSDATNGEKGQVSNEDPEQLTKISMANAIGLMALPYYKYTLGLIAQQSGDYVNAFTHLTEAAQLFQEQADDAIEIKMMACMATVIAMQAESQILLRQGKRIAAEQKNNDIITFIYSEVMPHGREIDPSMAGAFLVLLAMGYIGRSTSAMVSSFVGGDYNSALNYAAEIGTRIDEIRRAAEEIELVEHIRVNFEKIILVLTLQTNGLEAMAFAGQAAKRRDWAGFDRQISTAKARLRDAQRTCLEVKELAPRAEAIEMLIGTLVEPVYRHASDLGVFMNRSTVEAVVS